MEKEKQEQLELRSKYDEKARKLVELLAGMKWLEWCAIKHAVEQTFEEEKLKSELVDKDFLFRELVNGLCSYEHCKNHYPGKEIKKEG